MVATWLYVEGGGDAKALKSACREAFSEFLSRAGLKGHMPRIVACGSRRDAYDDFCRALESGRHAAMLLVDSEEEVAATSAWAHLADRAGDRWTRPHGAVEEDCQLMVQCMESWFLADPEALSQFFGQGFNAKAIGKSGRNIELQSKKDIEAALDSAIRSCKTRVVYQKGRHSFKILKQLDPQKVASASVWARRFIDN